MYILTWENYGKEKGHMKFEIIPHRTTKYKQPSPY